MIYMGKRALKQNRRRGCGALPFVRPAALSTQQHQIFHYDVSEEKSLEKLKMDLQGGGGGGWYKQKRLLATLNPKYLR
jgi:hypothetical protein